MDAARAARHVTRIGCWLTGPLVPVDGESGLARISDLAVAAERAGFDSFWVSDTVPDAGSEGPDSAVLEAYSLLGALATRTRSVRLGAIPSGPERRPPSMTAKIVTAIDVISHGRGILTFGTGGGSPDGDAGEVEGSGRLAEALRVGRAMLDDASPTFAGSVYAVAGAYNRPKPVQEGGIPLVAVTDPAGSPPRTLVSLADAADAVLVLGGIDDVGAAVAALRATSPPAGEGSASGPRTLQVLAIGGGSGRASAAGTDGSLDVAGAVASVRALFRLGVDGCLVPVSLATRPEDVARLGEGLADSPSDLL